MTAVERNNFELRRVDRPVDFEAIGFDLDDSSSRTAGDIAWSSHANWCCGGQGEGGPDKMDVAWTPGVRGVRQAAAGDKQY